MRLLNGTFLNSVIIYRQTTGKRLRDIDACVRLFWWKAGLVDVELLNAAQEFAFITEYTARTKRKTLLGTVAPKTEVMNPTDLFALNAGKENFSVSCQDCGVRRLRKRILRSSYRTRLHY
jgi:hypothetical protein